MAILCLGCYLIWKLEVLYNHRNFENRKIVAIFNQKIYPYFFLTLLFNKVCYNY